MKKLKKLLWFLFAILAVSIGLYPLMYILVDRSFFLDNNAGLLSAKSVELLNSTLWNTGFYLHIIFGGIALLTGWLQFSRKIRLKYIGLHRNMGKTYLVSVLFGGIGGIYIGLFATGGIVSIIGFVSLGIVWLSTTIFAFTAIRQGNVHLHQKLMIYSYAACFAAVTLRIWLPLLTISFQEFETAYRIVAWLCWVPNVIVAYFIVNKVKLTTT